jgi:hypothetical protein
VVHGLKTVSKETYYSVKKDLLQCQKRLTLCGPWIEGSGACAKDILFVNKEHSHL